MGQLVLAFTLSGEVEKYGAIAGFASIAGIGILALLFFAQARELRRLREWAGRAPERARELEQRVVADAVARQRVTAQPRSAPAGAATPAAPAARPAFAPAGTGAPALASATRALSPTAPEAPLPAPEPAPAPSAAPAVAPAPSAAPKASPPAREPAPAAPEVPLPAPEPPSAAPVPPPAEPAPAPVPAAAPRDPAPAPAPAAVAVPAAMTAAARSAGPVADRPAAGAAAPPGGAPSAAGVVAGNGRGQPPPLAPAPAVPARSPDPARPPAAPAPGVLGGGRERLARRWTVVLVVLGLLVLAGAVFAAIQFVDSRGGSSTTASTAPRAATARSARGAPFSRGAVTITVLNGTPVSGLAGRIADRLKAQGFRKGQVTNASDQARSATLISYLPGHRRAAEEVRRSLRLGAVEPIDATTKAIACPAPGACRSQVVVTVGADGSR